MAVILVFCLLISLASAGGVLGIPLAVIVGSWFFKYGFVLLDHAADGAEEPPVLSLEMVNPASEQRPLAFLLIACAFYAVTEWGADAIGSAGVGLLRIVAVLALPAMLMVQGATGSVLRSLDPRAVADLIRKVPGSYLTLLAAFAGLFLVGRGLLYLLPDPELPHALPLPVIQSVRLFVLMYLWLACFSLAGGVLYERRDDLGYEPTHSPEREETKLGRDRQRDFDRVADQIFAEWRGGAFRNAWNTVEAHLRGSADVTEALIELYRRAATWSDQRLAHRLAQEVLPKLLLARRTGEALDIIRSRVRQDPQFRPLQAAETLRVAELARDAGDRPTARVLLREFATRYPHDPTLSAAETLARDLDR